MESKRDMVCVMLIIRFPVASHLLGPVCLFYWSNFVKNGKVLGTDLPKDTSYCECVALPSSFENVRVRDKNTHKKMVLYNTNFLKKIYYCYSFMPGFNNYKNIL